MIFQNRQDAGKKLLSLLLQYKDTPNAVVIALPRGGVVTAHEIAQGLHLPLDIVCPRKIGAPYNPELALGAVTHTGAHFFNEDIIMQLGVSKAYLAQEIENEKEISLKRQLLYRKNRPPVYVQGKIVILVDDGLATGATMKAAIQWVKEQKAKKVVVAVPVAPPDTLQEVKLLVDEVFCLYAPTFFSAVGQFYEDFRQTTDEEVMELL